MLRNYFKIAVAVLLRRKFLTFVNLFGAVLTLTMLVVAFAMYQSVVSPGGAQHDQRRILSVFNAGIARSGGAGGLVGGPGYRLYEDYIAPLETPDKVSFTMTPVETTAYLDGRKIASQLRRTDAAYWDILDFDLIEGRWLEADDIDRGRFVAVIN
jgi:putative ABC transport system permease protein